MHFVAGRYDEVYQLAAEMGGAGLRVQLEANDLGHSLTSSAQDQPEYAFDAWHNCTRQRRP
jgi:hypothetical protein